jgi:hypothetical protein
VVSSASTPESGSAGETTLAAYISRELGDSVIALHDRLTPDARATIDHIWIAPTGVWVVDAEAYGGKVSRRKVGPIWRRRDNQVLVGRHNRTTLADGVVLQVDAVLEALGRDPVLEGIYVHGVLCFVGSEWGLFALPFQVGYVWVAHPRTLRRKLRKPGELARERMERAARLLDASLPRRS